MTLAMLALAAIVALSMHQADRLWDRTTALESRIEELRSQLARATAAGTTSNEAQDAELLGEAEWREGVSVTTPPRAHISAPATDDPGYARGGELVEILNAEPRTITPYVYVDSQAERVLEGNITESLGEFDPHTTELRGLLAEAWQLDPAGNWLRVKIDPRARFSDGSSVTSRDVLVTFNGVLMNPLVNAMRYREVFDAIERVEAVTDHVVEFTFREPMFNNLTLALRFPILPAHAYERFTPEQLNASTGLAIGSGPYRLRDASLGAQWAPGTGEDIVLVRNESYWRGSTPSFDTKRFRVITDRAARIVALKNGEAHIVSPSPTQFEAVRDDESFGARALAWPTFASGYTYIAWQCSERGGQAERLTPFHDARVRRVPPVRTNQHCDSDDRAGRIPDDPLRLGVGEPARVSTRSDQRRGTFPRGLGSRGQPTSTATTGHFR